MSKIWNVKGELKSDIGTLVRFYMKFFRRSYQGFLGKGVMGKQMEALLNQSHVIAPEHLSNSLGIHKKDGTLDIPIPYETWILSQTTVK